MWSEFDAWFASKRANGERWVWLIFVAKCPSHIVALYGRLCTRARTHTHTHTHTHAHAWRESRVFMMTVTGVNITAVYMVNTSLICLFIVFHRGDHIMECLWGQNRSKNYTLKCDLVRQIPKKVRDCVALLTAVVPCLSFREKRERSRRGCRSRRRRTGRARRSRSSGPAGGAGPRRSGRSRGRSDRRRRAPPRSHGDSCVPTPNWAAKTCRRYVSMRRIHIGVCVALKTTITSLFLQPRSL